GAGGRGREPLCRRGHVDMQRDRQRGGGGGSRLGARRGTLMVRAARNEQGPDHEPGGGALDGQRMFFDEVTCQARQLGYRWVAEPATLPEPIPMRGIAVCSGGNQ